DPADLAERVVPFLQRSGALGPEPTPAQRELLRAAAPLVQERMTVLEEAPGMLGFLVVEPDRFVVEDDAVASLGDDAPTVLTATGTALAGVGEWTHTAIEEALRGALVDGLGLKPKTAFTPVRVAVTGRRVSPPLFESIELLGRDLTVSRVTALEARLAG